jgi:hypothetical protein
MTPIRKDGHVKANKVTQKVALLCKNWGFPNKKYNK